MAKRFFVCKTSGDILGLLRDGGGELKLSCCGEDLKELKANTTDAAQEKHVPVANYDKAAGKVTVTVGSVAHPMTPEHLISWIHLETKKGAQICHLTPEDKPEAVFILADGDEPVAVYEYCNLHGLWKVEI